MADIVRQYKKETAPKSIRILASADGDPVFVFSSGGENKDERTVFENVSLNRFPFPNEVKHALAMYQSAWLSYMESDYLTADEAFALSRSGDELFSALGGNVERLQSICAYLVSQWFVENDWNTKVVK